MAEKRLICVTGFSGMQGRRFDLMGDIELSCTSAILTAAIAKMHAGKSPNYEPVHVVAKNVMRRSVVVPKTSDRLAHQFRTRKNLRDARPTIQAFLL
jgi:hypothetical protein